MVGDFRGIVEQVGYVSTVLLVLVFGAYQGLQTETIAVDIFGLFVQIVTIQAIPTTIFFSILVTLSGVLLAREVYRERDPDEHVSNGPHVAAIVPVYRDADVIQESLETLLASNYRNLEVVIVGEPDDVATLETARELAEKTNVRVLENRLPGSKANAINDAVARIDAEYIAVFDVDERIDPDFIPTAMYHLTEADQDIFQARRVPRVTGPVEGLAYCERLLFHAGYKLIEPFGFTLCRSSSSVFTREAFETVDGLDDMLTEDIDFAHKSFRAGLDVRQARYITNEMEAPHSLRDLWGQRKRWRLGHIEILFKALRFGYKRGGLRGKLSTARVISILAASVFLIAFMSKVILLLILDLESLFLLPFVAIALVVGPILYRDYQHGHIVTLTPAMLLVPLIYPGFGLLTIRSAFEYVISWNGEWYQVSKSGA